MTVQRVLGQPCWHVERLANVVTTIAKMDLERSHYFLASHTPIRNIIDERTKAFLNEEDLFQTLMDRGRSETLAVLYGDPGTGKSHLIHWLKLRSEHAVANKEVSNAVAVLIQRRKGSLKDALDQMVRQLPPGFEHYLEPVQQAIGSISATTARDMLATALFHELGPERWLERGREPLPRKALHGLREVCTSTGFREWLCRPDGVIDRNIKRLTETSTADERESLPEFTRAEFKVEARYRPNNTPQVHDFFDEFDEPDEPLAAEAARIFNSALRDALKELSGLGDNKLRDIFDRIRAELHKQGRFLALFIEDVSVLSELDTEVFKAVEPQSRPELGRLVAVLGMTHTGLSKLRDNEKERVTHLVSVGGSTEMWRDSDIDVARFTARYLNTIRLNEKEVFAVAGRRRNGADIDVSACDGCSVSATCHEVFGSADLDGTRIGLFPFTPSAPHRLLNALDTNAPGVRKNPRGFLDQVLRPLLAATDSFELRQFPPVGRLALAPKEPANWSPFVEQYCGTWAKEDRERLRFFVQGWCDKREVDDYAAELERFLSPLGFPAFTRAAQAAKRLTKPSASPPVKQPATPISTSREDEQPRELQEVLDTTRKWIADPSTELVKDKVPRELLHKFLRGGLRIEDYPTLPRSVFERLFKDIAAIHIEGQRSKPIRDTFAVFFPRSEETRDLLVALAHFRFVGRSSWRFPHAETYKRTCNRWLRKNQDRVLASCKPHELNQDLPIRSAVELLSLSAILRRRAKLPDERALLVAEVLAPLEDAPVSANPKSDFAAAIKRLVEGEHAAVREFLIDELGVPQGIGKHNFINPIPILTFARSFHDEPQVTAVPSVFAQDHWKPRYAPLSGAIARFLDLPNLLASEREYLRSETRSIRSTLTQSGYSDAELPALEQYIADVSAVHAALKRAKSPIPDEEFDKVRKSFSEARSWSTTLANAERLLTTEGVSEFVRFDPTFLLKVREVVRVVSQFVTRVEKEIDKAEKPLIARGDPDVLAAQLLEHVDDIMALAEAEED